MKEKMDALSQEMHPIRETLIEVSPVDLSSKSCVEKLQSVLASCQKKVCQHPPEEDVITLLKYGLQKVIIEGLQAFTDQSDAVNERNENLLDALLETINVLSENSSKACELVVPDVSMELLEMLNNPIYSFQQKMEILKTLNIMLEYSTFIIKEKLLLKPSFLDSLKKLFNLILHIGDYEFQVGAIECLFRLIPKKVRNLLCPKIICDPRHLATFLLIKDSNFETDCRTFLNNLNSSLGERKRVMSIPCISVQLGSRVLEKPSDPGYNEFWVDFNYGSRRITIFCEQDSLLQCSQSQEDDLWETISILHSDISSYKFTESNHIVSAMLDLTGDVVDIFSQMRNIEGNQIVIIADVAYNLPLAVQRTVNISNSTKKVSSVCEPLDITLFESSQSKPTRKPQPNHQEVIASSQKSVDSNITSASQKRPKMSVPYEPMSTPANSVCLDDRVKCQPSSTPSGESQSKNKPSTVPSESRVQKVKASIALAEIGSEQKKSSFQSPRTTNKHNKKRVKTPVVVVEKENKGSNSINHIPNSHQANLNTNNSNTNTKRTCFNEKVSYHDNIHSIDNDELVIPDSLPSQKNVDKKQTNRKLREVDSGICLVEPELSPSNRNTLSKIPDQIKQVPCVDCVKPGPKVSKSQLLTVEEAKKICVASEDDISDISSVSLPTDNGRKNIPENLHDISMRCRDDEEVSKCNAVISNKSQKQHSISASKVSTPVVESTRKAELDTEKGMNENNEYNRKAGKYTDKGMNENKTKSCNHGNKEFQDDSSRPMYGKGKGKSIPFPKPLSLSPVHHKQPLRYCLQISEGGKIGAKSTTTVNPAVVKSQSGSNVIVEEDKEKDSTQRKTRQQCKSIKKSVSESQINDCKKTGTHKENQGNDGNKKTDTHRDRFNQTDLYKENELNDNKKGRHKENERKRDLSLDNDTHNNLIDNSQISNSKDNQNLGKNNLKDNNIISQSKDNQKLGKKNDVEGTEFKGTSKTGNKKSTIVEESSTRTLRRRKADESQTVDEKVTLYQSQSARDLHFQNPKKISKKEDKPSHKISSTKKAFYIETKTVVTNSYRRDTENLPKQSRNREVDPYKFDFDSDSDGEKSVEQSPSKSKSDRNINNKSKKLTEHRLLNSKSDSNISTTKSGKTKKQSLWQQQRNAMRPYHGFSEDEDEEEEEEEEDEVMDYRTNNNPLKSKHPPIQSSKSLSNIGERISSTGNQRAPRKAKLNKIYTVDSESDGDVEIVEDSDSESGMKTKDITEDNRMMKSGEAALDSSKFSIFKRDSWGHTSSKKTPTFDRNVSRTMLPTPSPSGSSSLSHHNNNNKDNSTKAGTVETFTAISTGLVLDSNRRHKNGNTTKKHRSKSSDSVPGDLSSRKSLDGRSEVSWLEKKSSGKRKKFKKTYQKSRSRSEGNRGRKGDRDKGASSSSEASSDEQEQIQKAVKTKSKIGEFETTTPIIRASTSTTPKIVTPGCTRKVFSPLDIRVGATPRTPGLPSLCIVSEDNSVQKNKPKKQQSRKPKYQKDEEDDDEDEIIVDTSQPISMSTSQTTCSEDIQPTTTQILSLEQLMKVPTPKHIKEIIEEDEEDYDKENLDPLRKENIPNHTLGLISGPSSRVRLTKSALKRKYSNIKINDEEEDEENEDELSGTSNSQDANSSSFIPRKLFKSESPGIRLKGSPVVKLKKRQFEYSKDLTEKETSYPVSLSTDKTDDEEEEAEEDGEEGEESLKTGVTAVVRTFGVDIQNQLKAKRKQLDTIAHGTLKSSQKMVSNMWTDQKHKREEVLESYQEKMLEELKVLEKEINMMKEEEERTMNFYAQQMKLLKTYRDSQQKRIRNLSRNQDDLEEDLEKLDKDGHHQQQKLKIVLKSDLTGLQQKLLKQTQQYQLTNVKKFLQNLIL